MNFTIQIVKQGAGDYVCHVGTEGFHFDTLGEVEVFLDGLQTSLQSAVDSAMATFRVSENRLVLKDKR